MHLVILMAEDDEDDFVLVETAFAESHLDHYLNCVKDGDEMMDYLRRRGNYATMDEWASAGLRQLQIPSGKWNSSPETVVCTNL